DVAPARIAIVGPGGIGKTTLSIAVLHHPDIESTYEHRYFIPCEAATTIGELLSIIIFHLELEPSRQPSTLIVRFPSECGPTVLVLDNLETAWEPSESRHEVEELLCLLADVGTLTLVITLRGAERPGRVKWTRPFLAPLQPLHPVASRQTFIDISDVPLPAEESDLAELLDLTGHLPLAVSLMASVTAFEGYPATLSRWKRENTSLLSDAYEKESNLDKSISLSLTSPRMQSGPGALELLKILSVQPDGLSEVELGIPDIPIDLISECKAILLRTSLAYIDSDSRLKVLSPIREYVQRMHPP
ncbi:hypothetical protein C8R44DRAFT_535684, partial [Mycena epipterygia]